MSTVLLNLQSGEYELVVGPRLLADIEKVFPGRSYVEALNGVIESIRTQAPGTPDAVVTLLEPVLRRAGAPAGDLDHLSQLACGEIIGMVIGAIVAAEGDADDARPPRAAAPPSTSAA